YTGQPVPAARRFGAPPMNRRDFLDAGRVARTAGHVLALWLDFDQPKRPPEMGASLLRFSRRAMATNFELFLPFEQPNASELTSGIFDLIRNLEARLTVYL